MREATTARLQLQLPVELRRKKTRADPRIMTESRPRFMEAGISEEGRKGYRPLFTTAIGARFLFSLGRTSPRVAAGRLIAYRSTPPPLCVAVSLPLGNAPGAIICEIARCKRGSEAEFLGERGVETYLEGRGVWFVLGVYVGFGVTRSLL